MRISRTPPKVISELTVDADIDLLTLYQVKQLATPASGEALRKGNKDIGNAEIANAAAIAYSKLALALKIVNADIKGDAAIAYTKLALALKIVNADIKGDAAIAESKLNLDYATHSRYVDGEAVNAMGSKADNNPFNHDRYSDAEANTRVNALALLVATLTTDGDMIRRESGAPVRLSQDTLRGEMMLYGGM